jgi:CheY-like chemotaxis protein
LSGRNEGRPRALIADDNRINQRILASFVDRLGYDADVVGDGIEAVRAAREGGFAVILLDWEMPKMDGLTTTRMIRTIEEARGLRTPIVAVTAHGLRGDREACIAAGMDEHVTKPVIFAELDRVISRVTVRQRAAAPTLPAPPPEPAPPDDLIDPLILAELRVPAGDTVLLDELIDLYLRDGPGRVEAIVAAVARGDTREITRCAHLLKGSSANLSARLVREISGAIEARAREGSIEGLGELCDRLRAAFEATATRLRAERSPITG